MVELSICDRDHMACKAENIDSMALYRKFDEPLSMETALHKRKAVSSFVIYT